MRVLPAFAAALLTASLALAGCGASNSSDSAGTSKAGGAPAPADNKGVAGPEAAADEAAPEKEEAGGRDADEQAAGERADEPPSVESTHVIRTASLTVRVKDVTKALATARTTALDAGGLVQSESTERVDDSHVTSHVVLRVPQEAYDSVITALAGTGKLEARTAQAKDVTDEVVDVRSRIETQRASVTRVRELMDQAEDITDVVALESQLSSRQAELESLLARQASLADRTTLATITLDLAERAPEKEAVDDSPGVLDALGGGWDAFVSMLRWIAIVLGAVAPFLAALGLLYVLWRVLGVRLLGLRRERARQGEPALRPQPAPMPAHAPGGGPGGPGGPGSHGGPFGPAGPVGPGGPVAPGTQGDQEAGARD